MKISSHKDPRKLPEDMLSEDEIEKMIWVGIGTVGRNIPMRYYAIRMHLKRIATRAGINFLFKYEDESIIP